VLGLSNRILVTLTVVRRNFLFLSVVRQSRMMASDVNFGLVGVQQMRVCVAFT
jgi:hypothetical protein